MRAGAKSLESYAAEQLEARLKKLGTNLRRAAKDTENAGHIHDLRVAIRRHTQAMRVFADLLDRGRVRRIQRKLRKVMDLCGETRNCDIALAVLAAAGVTPDGPLKRRLERGRVEAAARLKQHLKDWKINRRIRIWGRWLHPEGGPPQTAPSAARRALRPLAAEFFRTAQVAAKPDSTPEQLHRFRLLSKRLRYSLEIFEPVLGADGKRALARLRELQERLGAVNDCAASAAAIARLGEDGPPLRRARRALRRLLRERMEAFRAWWREHMDAKEQRRWRHWIGNIK